MYEFPHIQSQVQQPAEGCPPSPCPSYCLRRLNPAAHPHHEPLHRLPAVSDQVAPVASDAPQVQPIPKRHPRVEEVPQSSMVSRVPAVEHKPIIAAQQNIHLSDQIHVLGTDTRGRYLTHALATCGTLPPVRLFSHKWSLTREWEESGRRILVHRGDECIPSGLTVLEQVSHHGLPTAYQTAIDQLVVTVPAVSAVRAFSAISHRVDEKTIVCLLQDGLGVAEALNEAYFPDPLKRPSYVLGHMTHVLSPQEGKRFTVSEIHQGRVYLSALGRSLAQSRIRYHPPTERNVRVSHFLQLLSAAPRLQAGGYSLDRFLHHKLQATVIKAVLDPLTVVLDCNFGKLAGNTYAKQMIDQLLGEISSVISRLPELRGSTHFQGMIRGGGLRQEVYKRLGRLKDSNSRMYAQTKRGFETDIDFLNGYFAKRGREVGVKCSVNESVIWMVKAKHMAQMAQARDATQVHWE